GAGAKRPRPGAPGGRAPRASLPPHELVDAAVEGEDGELALGVLAERGDVQPGVAPQVDQLAVDDRLAVLLAEAPDPAGLVVAIDVHADQLGQRLAAVDVAPGDALAVVLAGPGSGVRVLD